MRLLRKQPSTIGFPVGSKVLIRTRYEGEETWTPGTVQQIIDWDEFTQIEAMIAKALIDEGHEPTQVAVCKVDGDAMWYVWGDDLAAVDLPDRSSPRDVERWLAR